MIRYLANRIPRRGMSAPELLFGCAAVCLGLALGWLLMRPTTRAEAISVAANKPLDGESDAESKSDELSAVVLQEIRRLQQEVTQLRVSQEPQDKDHRVAVRPAAKPVRVHAASRSAVPSRPARATGPQQRPPSQPAPSASEQIGRSTLSYWNKLNEIMASEEAMRKAPTNGLTVANVGNFLSRRGQAGTFAARAIRKLNTENVDAAVVAQAQDIASWYEQGNRLNSTAKHLFHNAGTDERQGKPGQQWGEAEKSHGQSVSELNRRGDELRRQLIDKYQLPFPDLR